MDNLINFDLFANLGKLDHPKGTSTTILADHHAKDSQSVCNDQDSDREQVIAVVNAAIAHGIDLTAGYKNWVNVGFALKDALGEEGREHFHALSSMNSEYDYSVCDKKYTSLMKSCGEGIHSATLFQMAKDAGIDISQLAREATRNAQVSATSAIPPSANNIEKIEKNTILGSFDEGMTDGGLAEVAESTSFKGTGYTFSDKLKVDDLDYLLHFIYDLHSKDTTQCDAQILAALNMAGGMMGAANGTPNQRSGVYGIYDGRRVYAPTYNIVFGTAGVGKGPLIFSKYLLYAVKKEIRDSYETDKQQFIQNLAEWEATNKKERGAAPTEPIYRDPFVPGNSSSSAVYRAMDANQGYGLMFDTEADTVSNMIDSDYGNYSDLMRKAHHHETLSMNRVTDKIHIEIEEPRLAIFLSCTPGQLPALFPSFENGLGSRFLFYYTPDEGEPDFNNVFAQEEMPLDDVYKKLGDYLLPLYHALQMRAGHPIQFVMSQNQQREFLATYREILKQQFKMLGKGIRAFIYRIALECFRYAMTLTTLRRLSDWHKSFSLSNPEQPSIFRDDENALVCDDRDFAIAMQIIGCLINHTAQVYAVMAKDEENPFAMKGIKLTAEERTVYDALPEGNFRTADFLSIASEKNIKERSAERMLSKFANRYHIVLPMSERGVYCKPSRKEIEP